MHRQQRQIWHITTTGLLNKDSQIQDYDLSFLSHTFFFMSNPACDYVTERGVKVSVPAQLWLVSTWCWKQIWKVSFSNFSLTIVDLLFFPQIYWYNQLLHYCNQVIHTTHPVFSESQVIRTAFHWCSSIKPTTESEDHQSQLGLIIRELWIFHSDPNQKISGPLYKKLTQSGQRTGQLQFTVAGCCCHIFDQQRLMGWKEMFLQIHMSREFQFSI